MNKFGVDHLDQFLLYFLIPSSKVATFNQIQDYANFGFSQNHPFLHTTTTNMCHLLIESLPPKRIAKFKNYFLSAILSNTLWA
jgi:hypothetical protein